MIIPWPLYAYAALLIIIKVLAKAMSKVKQKQTHKSKKVMTAFYREFFGNWVMSYFQLIIHDIASIFYNS